MRGSDHLNLSQGKRLLTTSNNQTWSFTLAIDDEIVDYEWHSEYLRIKIYYKDDLIEWFFAVWHHLLDFALWLVSKIQYFNVFILSHHSLLEIVDQEVDVSWELTCNDHSRFSDDFVAQIFERHVRFQDYIDLMEDITFGNNL